MIKIKVTLVVLVMAIFCGISTAQLKLESNKIILPKIKNADTIVTLCKSQWMFMKPVEDGKNFYQCQNGWFSKTKHASGALEMGEVVFKNESINFIKDVGSTDCYFNVQTKNKRIVKNKKNINEINGLSVKYYLTQENGIISFKVK